MNDWWCSEAEMARMMESERQLIMLTDKILHGEKYSALYSLARTITKERGKGQASA